MWGSSPEPWVEITWKESYEVRNEKIYFQWKEIDDKRLLKASSLKIVQAWEYCFVFQNKKGIISSVPSFLIIKWWTIIGNTEDEENVFSGISDIDALTIDEKWNWAFVSQSESGDYFLYQKGKDKYELAWSVIILSISEDWVSVVYENWESEIITNNDIQEQQKAFRKRADGAIQATAWREKRTWELQEEKERESIKQLQLTIIQLQEKEKRLETQLTQTIYYRESLKAKVAKSLSLSYEEQEVIEAEFSWFDYLPKVEEKLFLEKRLVLERIKKIEWKIESIQKERKDFINNISWILKKLPKSFFWQQRVISPHLLSEIKSYLWIEEKKKRSTKFSLFFRKNIYLTEKSYQDLTYLLWIEKPVSFITDTK